MKSSRISCSLNWCGVNLITNRRPTFQPLRRWAPAYWRHLLATCYWRPLLTGAPLGFRTCEFEERSLVGKHEVYRFSYHPQTFGNRICVTVAPGEASRIKIKRLMAITSALWDLRRLAPDLTYHDLHIESSDCGDPDVPVCVLRSVKLPGEPHALIPNLYLLAKRRRRVVARPWARKANTAWFRGASTGSRCFEENARVRLCQLAKRIDGADCKLTATPGVSPAFARQCAEAGLMAAPTSPAAMNAHRILIDVDGNTSSWDRYLWTGRVGAVPLRFEPRWLEVWHRHLVEGENVVTADRSTLARHIAALRDDDARSRGIAEQARQLVRRLFAREAVLRTLAEGVAAVR